MNQVEVYVEICRDGVFLPGYVHSWDAGMDVLAAENTLVRAGDTVIVPSGLKFAIPEGYEIQVRPRSGISARTPLRVPNAPGTVDSGFRDELGILVTNTSEPGAYANEDIITIDSPGNRRGHYLIRKGDRIAQLVLAEVPRMKLVVVTSVAEIGADRGGGFGSTGFGAFGAGLTGTKGAGLTGTKDAGLTGTKRIGLTGNESDMP
jgi:dUTP pyrophosphatase